MEIPSTPRTCLALGTCMVVLSLALALCGCGSSADSASNTVSATPPTSPSSNAPTASSGSAASSASTDGAGLFAQNCAGCHGDKGAGGKRAPTLAGKKIAASETTEIVTNGKKRMPAFKGRLKDDQIKAIADYVATL